MSDPVGQLFDVQIYLRKSEFIVSLVEETHPSSRPLCSDLFEGTFDHNSWYWHLQVVIR